MFEKMKRFRGDSARKLIVHLNAATHFKTGFVQELKHDRRELVLAKKELVAQKAERERLQASAAMESKLRERIDMEVRDKEQLLDETKQHIEEAENKGQDLRHMCQDLQNRRAEAQQKFRARTVEWHKRAEEEFDKIVEAEHFLDQKQSEVDVEKGGRQLEDHTTQNHFVIVFEESAEMTQHSKEEVHQLLLAFQDERALAGFQNDWVSYVGYKDRPTIRASRTQWQNVFSSVENAGSGIYHLTARVMHKVHDLIKESRAEAERAGKSQVNTYLFLFPNRACGLLDRYRSWLPWKAEVVETAKDMNQSVSELPRDKLKAYICPLGHAKQQKYMDHWTQLCKAIRGPTGEQDGMEETLVKRTTDTKADVVKTSQVMTTGKVGSHVEASNQLQKINIMMEHQDRRAERNKEAMERFSQAVLQAERIEDSTQPFFQKLKEDYLRQLISVRDEYNQDLTKCTEMRRDADRRCSELTRVLEEHDVQIQETEHLIGQLEKMDGQESIVSSTGQLKDSKIFSGVDTAKLSEL